MPFQIEELLNAHTTIEEALTEVFGNVPSIFVVVDITDQLDMDRELMRSIDPQFSSYDIFHEIRKLIFHVSPTGDKDMRHDGAPALAAIKVLDAFGRGDEVDPIFRP
jgi:hypothetical protein